jgi:DNA primase
LHRKAGTLHKELKDAEAALAAEPSEANLARLVDIQAELANSDGIAALIDGFGASSGRRATGI